MENRKEKERAWKRPRKTKNKTLNQGQYNSDNKYNNFLIFADFQLQI